MDLPITKTHIKRVEQWTIEDEYSRANVRKHVKEALEEMLDSTHICVIHREIENRVLEYYEADYYESKGKRVNHLQNRTVESIALDIMISVIPVTRKSPIQSIATRLAKQLDFDDVFDGVRTASELLGACAKTGLYQVWLNPITLQCNVPMPAELINYINKTQYLNPSICEPAPWVNNTNGGYLSICQSVILGKHNHHNKKQALGALNIAQEVEWELDDYMVNFIEKPKNKCITQQQIDGHIRQTNGAIDVYQDLMDQGNSFYFVWRFDFRGRMYTQGYFVNLQSTDYKKSILNFKNKQVIN
jgi:DNA-directed RNA polymerase